MRARSVSPKDASQTLAVIVAIFYDLETFAVGRFDTLRSTATQADALGDAEFTRRVVLEYRGGEDSRASLRRCFDTERWRGDASSARRAGLGY